MNQPFKETRLTANRTAAGLLLAAFLSGCGKDPDPPHLAEADQGRAGFESYCSACHQLDGSGTEGGAPPLAASPWVAGADARLVRIVLHGVRGRMEVGGKTYDLEMPGFGPILTDAQIADLLSFVRRRFGGSSAPVTPAAVGRIRAETLSHDTYWTVDELLEVR